MRTYIQSGNVVFQAPATLAARIPALIAGGIKERFGFRVSIVTRTAEHLRQVVYGNPYLSIEDDTGRPHVAFLADVPKHGRVEALDPGRSPPDAFEVRGREIFLDCPNGLARTKLTNAYFDSTLATTSTIRNWRTVTKLLAMAETD